MRKNSRWIQSIGWFIVAIAFLGMASGCSTLSGGKSSSNQAPVKKKEGPSPTYYDFGDVLVPHELKIDEDGTYVIESAGFLTGILALKGRVEKNSLVEFFKNNMAKDNWQAITSFKTPNRALLLFKKSSRWCIINITESKFSTYVEVGVVPSTAGRDAGLMK